MGTAALNTMTISPHPASLSGIRAYLRATHLTLIIGTAVAPGLGLIMAGQASGLGVILPLSLLIATLGAVALHTEWTPDRRFSRLWRRTPLMVTWCVALMLASVALISLPPPGRMTPSVLAVSLALRAVGFGSFWASSLRIVVAALGAVLATLLLSQASGFGEPAPALTVAIGALLALTVIGQDAVFTLALEVDGLRSLAADRAVTKERQRFAGDLHDIQGQHLQLLTVEAQLIRRLIDTGRHTEAARHADRVHDIAITAPDEMRGVVHDCRTVTSEAEAVNAVKVLEAAGIDVDVRVDISSTLPTQVDRLLGLTIREGITNILRHTRTRHCTLLVHPQQSGGRVGMAITLTDAGPATGDGGDGSGLATLQQRYSRAGGQLTFTATPEDGSRLTAWVPLPRNGSA
ncbi:MAG: histidine kinase [Propionibacteriales bacterium]|nr:histidine kinase [Propionibacteriales bacterium]